MATGRFAYITASKQTEGPFMFDTWPTHDYVGIAISSVYSCAFVKDTSLFIYLFIYQKTLLINI